MTTTTWSIKSITILPSVDGLTDFAWQVLSTCTASNGVTQKSTDVFAQFDPTQQSGPYTPYDQLTEEQVLGWVYTYMGPEIKAKTETNLIGSVESQVAPLPWSV